MPTETQLEQRVAALQSDLNARDQALDDAATENNKRELSRRDWFDEAQRLQAELHELTGKWERFEEFEHGLQAKLAERDALLLEAVSEMDDFITSGLSKRIRSVLSASAEPSAPVAEQERRQMIIERYPNVDPLQYEAAVNGFAAAPVAVVLPERKARRDHGLTALDRESDGWNSCLDEVARLNPPQQ